MIPLDGLLDLYLEAHAEWRRGEVNERTLERGWRASSLGSCYRRQVLEHLGVPRTREIDAQARRTFAWGDHVHDWARRVLWRCGVVEHEELELADPARNLTGHVDVVLRWPPREVDDAPTDIVEAWSPEWRDFLGDLRRRVVERLELDLAPGELVGLELKSAKSSAMRHIMREGPREEHTIQVGAYAAMAATSHPEITRWAVSYVGKDAVGILTFGALPAWRERAVERVERLEAWRRAGTDPADVPCECEGWQVAYCAYATGGTCCLRPEEAA